MTVTNTELLQALQDTTTGWQTFNAYQVEWLTSTEDTVDIYDAATEQTITVLSLYKITSDYEQIFDEVSGDLATIEQMLTNASTLEANVQLLHDAVVAYDATYQGYLQSCADDAAAAAASAAAAANSAVAAANSVVSAEGHADDAEASATAAATSETNAAASATTASNAITAAELARDEAQGYQLLSLADAQAAAASETNAATSETNAAASEAKAEDWAEELEDVEVETGKYSALHWAAKAAATAASIEDVSADAAAAAQSATDAQTAQTAAEAAQGDAEIARDAAQTYQLQALANQQAAEAAETASELARDEAQGYQLTALANQQAAEAAEAKAQDWAEELEDVEVETGKYSALHHSAKAANFESLASTAWLQAESAKNGAETAETNAASSASAAATSASNASSSASAASSSASSASSSASSASSSASSASSSASSAATSASNASDSADAAAASAASITDRESLFIALGGSGGLSGLTSEATAQFNSVEDNSNGSVFSLSSHETTINKAGRFHMLATMSFGITDANSSTVRVFFQKSTNGGSTWTTVSNTLGHASMSAAYKHDTVSIQAVVNITSGTMFRVRALRLNGSSSTIYQVNNCSQLTFIEI